MIFFSDFFRYLDPNICTKHSGGFFRILFFVGSGKIRGRNEIREKMTDSYLFRMKKILEN